MGIESIHLQPFTQGQYERAAAALTTTSDIETPANSCSRSRYLHANRSQLTPGAHIPPWLALTHEVTIDAA